MTIEVNGPVADYFMQQCVGVTDGMHCHIPVNPQMYTLMKANKVESKEDFVAFLLLAADQLERDAKP